MFFVASLQKITREGKEKFVNPCGTDYGTYINLKTVKGIEKRIKGATQRKGVEKIALYEFSDHDKYNEKNWRLRGIYNVINNKVDTSISVLDSTIKIEL